MEVIVVAMVAAILIIEIIFLFRDNIVVDNLLKSIRDASIEEWDNMPYIEIPKGKASSLVVETAENYNEIMQSIEDYIEQLEDEVEDVKSSAAHKELLLNNAINNIRKLKNIEEFIPYIKMLAETIIGIVDDTISLHTLDQMWDRVRVVKGGNKEDETDGNK